MTPAIFLSTDVDRWLFGVLSVDPLLQQYAPGGFWAQDPPQGVIYPCVRWWSQAAGTNVTRQDGELGLSEAQPRYVVTMLDRQTSGELDKVGGTSGSLELGAKRIGKLLHRRYEPVNGFQWLASIIGEYQGAIKLPQGETDVVLGFLFQIRAQPL